MYIMNMDMKKLFKRVLENEEVRSIPLDHVLIVLGVIIEEIGSGECFLDTEYD